MVDLNWRYATKGFDTEAKISDTDIQQIVEAVRLTPSSYGLQPYKILVVSDQETKLKLHKASYGQSQISDCSHVIVFCVDSELSSAHVDSYMELLCETRGVALDSMDTYKATIAGFVNSMSEADRTVWAKKQSYIGLGFLLFACAERKIDACPMEGFVANEYDEILGLKEKGLTTSVVATLGFRDENDKTQHRAKVRKPSEAFADFI